MNAALRAVDRFLSDVTGGRGWYTMSVDMNLGLPFVHLDVDFVSPVRGDADLDCEVSVTRLGDTSCGIRVTGWQAGTRCFTLDTVSVMTVPGKGKHPLPDWLRSALEPYLA